MSINSIIKKPDLILCFYKSANQPEEKIGSLADFIFKEYTIRALSSSPAALQIVARGTFTADKLLDLYTPSEIRGSLSSNQKEEIREFFRRIDKQELSDFLAKMHQLDAVCKGGIEALKNGNLDHSIYQHKEIERYALQAFIYGQIDRFRLSEILIFLAVRSTPNQKTLQLLSENKTRNEEAIQTLKASLKYYSEEEIEQFLTDISYLPPERTSFYSVPVSRSYGRRGFEVDVKFLKMTLLFKENVDVDKLVGEIHQKSDQEIIERVRASLQAPQALKESSLRDALTQVGLLGKEIYNIVRVLMSIHQKFLIDERHGERQIVLAPHLMLPLLKAKFGAQTMFPNLVLGESAAAENFKKENKRDILIPSTLFPHSTPSRADGFSANSLEFYHHDIAYHLLLECANDDRYFWIKVAEAFNPSNPQAPFFSKKWYIRLLDREFPAYLVNFKTPESSLSFEQTLTVLKAALSTPSFLREMGLPPDASQKFEKVVRALRQHSNALLNR